jgi:hypothetical protein
MPNKLNCVQNNCVECRTTGDCQAGLKCSDKNTCVECTQKADCDGELKCNVNGQCVDCLRNTHCENAEMPFCNTADNTCEAGCQLLENGDNCQTRFKQKPHCIDNGQCVACTQGGPNPPNNCPTVDGQNYDVCVHNICGEHYQYIHRSFISIENMRFNIIVISGYMVSCKGFLFTNAAGRVGVLRGPEVELIIRGRISHHHTTYDGVENEPPYLDFRLNTYSLPWFGIGNAANANHNHAIEPFQDLYDKCKTTVEDPNTAYRWDFVDNNNWFFRNNRVEFNYFGAVPIGYIP